MRVLEGSELAAAVETIVTEAKKTLVLVSPYFKPWKRLEMEIQNTASRRVATVLVVRREEDPKKDVHIQRAREFTRFGKNVTAVALTRLHAKVYANEQQILVTSMNLLQSSMEGSWEMGIAYNRRDGDDYMQVWNALKKLLGRVDAETKRRAAEAPSIVRPPAELPARRSKRAPKAARKTKQGYCIRCSVRIPLNPERPYCQKCFGSWARYENEEYEEAACHQCGRDWHTSMLRPVCITCFRKRAR